MTAVTLPYYSAGGGKLALFRLPITNFSLISFALLPTALSLAPLPTYSFLRPDSYFGFDSPHSLPLISFAPLSTASSLRPTPYL